MKSAEDINITEAHMRAQAAALPGEELKTENFNRVNTEGFEKAVVLLKYWTEMTMREMFKESNFRIETNYNAEARETDFAIYTPTEHAGENNKNEVVSYDDRFLMIPDDDEQSIIITTEKDGATLKLNAEKAEILAAVIQNQIQLWK